MKKFIYSILALSILGSIISSILLIQHFYPDSAIAAASCSGIESSCLSLSSSKYSTIFNIPLASFGLFLYLFITFVILIADYAKGFFYKIALLVLFPISILAVVINIILAGVLFYTNLFCYLCAITYLINILIVVLFYILYKQNISSENENPITIFKEIFSLLKTNTNFKAAFSSFTLFAILLLFSVFSTSHIMHLKTADSRVSHSDIKSFINNFFASKQQEFDFHESKIILGNPNAEVTVKVYIDFLCSACYSFYKTEKYLLTKYKDKIKIEYYNYPLDTECNGSVKRTVYKNSCLASKVMIAAAKLGILEDYMQVHFNNYKNIKKTYNLKTAISILEITLEKTDKKIDENEFINIINSEETENILYTDLEYSDKIHIDATPTIFLFGRKLRGAPPKEMLDAIFQKELKE